MIKRVSEVEKEKFVEWYKSGWSIYRISKESGFNEATVKKWLKKRDVQLETKKYDFSNKKKKKINENILISMYYQGKTIDDIMAFFSVKRNLVKYYLQKNSLPTDRGKCATKGGFNELEKRKIINLYTKEKRGAQHIGNLFNRSDNNITYWLNKWNVPKHDRKIISSKIREVYGPTKGFKGRCHTEETKKKISKSGSEAWNNETRISKTNKSRTFKTKIGKVLGTYEVAYLQQLILENKNLPTIPKKRVKTEYGTYLPDFEYHDRFIEIKSEFTLKVAQGKMPNNKGEFSDKQWKKIKWTNNKFKKVDIVVLEPKEALDLFKKAIETGFVLDKIEIKNNKIKII